MGRPLVWTLGRAPIQFAGVHPNYKLICFWGSADALLAVEGAATSLQFPDLLGTFLLAQKSRKEFSEPYRLAFPDDGSNLLCFVGCLPFGLSGLSLLLLGTHKYRVNGPYLIHSFVAMLIVDTKNKDSPSEWNFKAQEQIDWIKPRIIAGARAKLDRLHCLLRYHFAGHRIQYTPQDWCSSVVWALHWWHTHIDIYTALHVLHTLIYIEFYIACAQVVCSSRETELKWCLLGCSFWDSIGSLFKAFFLFCTAGSCDATMASPGFSRLLSRHSSSARVNTGQLKQSTALCPFRFGFGRPLIQYQIGCPVVMFEKKLPNSRNSASILNTSFYASCKPTIKNHTNNFQLKLIC